MSEILYKKYAKVLFEVAQESNAVDAIFQDTAALRGAFEQLSNFLKHISDPTLNDSQKESATVSVLKGKVSDPFYRFLVFLINKNRLNILPGICREYQVLYNEEKKLMEAEIVTGMDIDEDFRKEIVSQLEKKFERKILPQFKTVPYLLGGIRISLGGKVIDQTLRDQLKRFNKSIIFA